MNSPKPPYWKETIHNQKRRASWHDYHGRCIYMVTFSKTPECPKFSEVHLVNETEAELNLTPIGEVIKGEIEITPRFNPQVSILEYVVMPDHVHILIFVREFIKKPLGSIVQVIKSAAAKKIRNLSGNETLSPFEPGFNDQILKAGRSLDDLKNYIRTNPYRLAVRRAHPNFFTRRQNIVIGEIPCQAYGNLQLLDNPFKEQVVVHRVDSPVRFSEQKERWLYTAANGGVLVSPFISPREKIVRVEAEALGSRIILINEEPFGEREKPSAHDFAQCCAGTLLIISPLQPLEFSREACLMMNSIAAEIAKTTPNPAFTPDN